MLFTDKIFNLSLKGDTFNALISDFDGKLSETFKKMAKMGSDMAEVNVKLKISLEKNAARLPMGMFAEEYHRDFITPTFEHKVGSVIQIKSETSGKLDGNYVLEWDEERGQFVMREIGNDQLDLNSCEYGAGKVVVSETEAESPEPTALIGGAEILAIGQNPDYDDEDAEYDDGGEEPEEQSDDDDDNDEPENDGDYEYDEPTEEMPDDQD